MTAAGAGMLARATAVGAGAFTRARIATRTCDGRPLAGAGVNLKSVSERLLPARAAASFGSAFAGVNEDRLSRLSETAGGRFLLAPVASAGVSASPAAATAASSWAYRLLARLSKNDSPCSGVDIVRPS